MLRTSVLLLSAFVLPGVSQTTACSGKAHEVTVPGTQQWTDAGIDVKAGEQLIFFASGTLQFQGKEATAAGLTRGWRDLLRSLPVNSAGSDALVGRIGAEGLATPFLIGESSAMTAHSPGRLFLGVNQLATDSSAGAYKVSICTVAAAKNAVSAAATVQISSATLDQIPRHVADQSGSPGDMVNFLVVGNQDKLLAAFQDAGWVQVDKTKALAVLDATLMTLQKKSYVQMPMSELYLFGRAQDFGLAHAEPIRVVASRHHLRLWQAPEKVDGKTLWVGAATHDIGFERDQRGDGRNITHKIDADVDAERQFVHDSLTAGGGTAGSSYVLPSNPVREAHTATGESFHSDGRILIISLP